MISLARYCCYEKYSVIRTKEHKDLYNKDDVTFRDLFYGVSKDYGLVAQKPGGPEGLIEAIDSPLRYETGISIDEMIKRLDLRLETLSNRVHKLEAFPEQKPANELHPE